MATADLASSCQNASYVFQSFDSLFSCYGISNSLPDFNNTVSTCLVDYCKAPHPSLKGCPTDGSSSPIEFVVQRQPWTYFSDQNGYCENVSKTANTDIGGPGIFYSYLIQILMIWLIWLVLRFFKIVPKICRQASWIGRKANRAKFSDSAASHSSNIVKLFHKQDFILKSILVEFQETQCFFMVACQAVVLFSKKHHNIFSATNMVNVWADHAIAGMCAAAGSFPVAWSLWTLQRSNMVSGWILFLSTATLGVSQFALYSMSRTPNLGEMGHLDGSFPESCGRHPPPMRYCGWEGLEDSMIPVVILTRLVNPFTLTLYGVTLIMFFWPLIKKALWSGRVVDSRPRLTRFFSRMTAIWYTEGFRIVKGIITALVEIFILLMFLVYIICLCFQVWGVEVAKMEVIDMSAWGFGQFVALTTWAAVLCKYIYWTIFGTEAYAESRFGEGNHITQDDNPDSGNGATKSDEKPRELPRQNAYESLGASQDDVEMGRFSGARFYQDHTNRQSQQDTYDPVASQTQPPAETAPLETEAEFIPTGIAPTPRQSIYMPPQGDSHHEQDELHDDREPERFDSEAHLIRKDE